MSEIVVIAHDIRSAHNVGALLRTSEGLGVNKIYFTGYTPYPKTNNDSRLPHIFEKLEKQIHKTALGAQKSIAWTHAENIEELLEQLRRDGYMVIALEQTKDSIPLPNYKPPQKVALLLGREVEGIEPNLLKLCHQTIEIPMHGQKESFNVVQAASMALYHLTFFPFD